MTVRPSSPVAIRRADLPIETYRGYDVSWDGKAVLIYDDVAAADALAAELGTSVKHTTPRTPRTNWSTFSLVRLRTDEPNPL